MPAGPRKPAAPGENEPEYDESLCILDWCKFLFVFSSLKCIFFNTRPTTKRNYKIKYFVKYIYSSYIYNSIPKILTSCSFGLLYNQ